MLLTLTRSVLPGRHSQKCIGETTLHATTQYTDQLKRTREAESSFDDRLGEKQKESPQSAVAHEVRERNDCKTSRHMGRTLSLL